MAVCFPEAERHPDGHHAKRIKVTPPTKSPLLLKVVTWLILEHSSPPDVHAKLARLFIRLVLFELVCAAVSVPYAVAADDSCVHVLCCPI